MSSRISRRALLKQAAVVGAATLCTEHAMSGSPASPLQIEEPFHGAVVHARLGRPTPEGLAIRVSGVAPGARSVSVQGRPARLDGERFLAEALLTQAETDIDVVAQCADGACRKSVRVVWDRKSFPRYRFSIDDNSFFLRDVIQKQYKSLFDCFYLRDLRELHRKHGVRFVLNIYYTTGDDFNLTQFPDRYKSEWRDNADWLRLAFHAHADKPDRPYTDAPPEKLLADLDQVAEQIVRFAGNEAYSPPTVIHWAMTRPTAWRPLYSRGVRVLSGYFRQINGKWDINYNMDDVRSEWLSRHDALKDFESGIVFSRVDMVLDQVPVDKVEPGLLPVLDDPNRNEIIDLFTHEQYFWPFYKAHRPDMVARLDRALALVSARGNKPVFFHEGFLGVPA